MPVYVIEFAPPMLNLDGKFNTFRLGLAWSKRVVAGNKVLLINRPKCEVIGPATVTAVHVGKLAEMAALYGRDSHNHRDYPPDVAASRIVEAMIKRYGPQRCNENSKVTVIYLER